MSQKELGESISSVVRSSGKSEISTVGVGVVDSLGKKEVKSENLYQTERFHGSFSRSFKLPATVNNEKIRAEYRDGVLSITLPKLEAAKPLKIKVLNE